jgi:hypothetical protein
MHSLLVNDLKNNSSREIIEISKKQQRQTLGGGEETTIIFIGPKPPIGKVIFLGPPIPSL